MGTQLAFHEVLRWHVGTPLGVMMALGNTPPGCNGIQGYEGM